MQLVHQLQKVNSSPAQSMEGWIFGCLRLSQFYVTLIMVLASTLTSYTVLSLDSSTQGDQILPTLASLVSSSSLYDEVQNHNGYEEHILPYQKTTDRHIVENIVLSSSGVELEVSYTNMVPIPSASIVENSNSKSSATEFTRQQNLYQKWNDDAMDQSKKSKTSENGPKINMDTVIISSEFVPTVTFISTSRDSDIEGGKAYDSQVLSGYMDSMIKTDSNISEDHDSFTTTTNDMSKNVPSVTEGHCGAQDECTML